MQEIIDSRNKLLSTLSEIIENWYPSSYNYEDLILKPIASNEDQFVGISLDDPEKIAYARSTNDKFNPKTRIKTSFERYVRRQLEIDENTVSDYNLNFLGRQLRIRLLPTEILEQRIEILTGDEITDFYRTTNISSCMTGCEWKTQLYALNPEIISLVLYNKKARALLWTTEDYIEETKSFQKILDRVYPENSEDSTMLKSWAERKGYIRRISTGLCTDTEIELSNSKVYTFILKHNNTFPYMDTFCYGELSNKTIQVSNESFDDCIELHETDGSYCGACKCYECGCNMNEDDVIYEHDEPYCESCHNENFSICNSCEEYYHNDNLTEVRIHGRTKNFCECCLREDCFRCDSCREYFSKSDAIYYDDDVYCSSCFSDNFSGCYICEDDVPNDDVVNFDNESYCPDCAKEKITTCHKCGSDILKKDSETIEDNYYCSTCSKDVI